MQNDFFILMVCTGNICRSPLAEHLLAKQVADLAEVQVSSAGTHALVGHDMFPETQRIAQAHGVEDADTHRARQVTQEILESSDVILTMTREQRREAVELSPKITRRIFTLREFARLIDATPQEILAADLEPVEGSTADKLRAAVQSVALSRNMASVSNPADNDVIDPYRQSAQVHEASAQQLVPAVDTVADLVRRVVMGTIP